VISTIPQLGVSSIQSTLGLGHGLLPYRCRGLRRLDSVGRLAHVGISFSGGVGGSLRAQAPRGRFRRRFISPLDDVVDLALQGLDVGLLRVSGASSSI